MQRVLPIHEPAVDSLHLTPAQTRLLKQIALFRQLDECQLTHALKGGLVESPIARSNHLDCETLRQCPRYTSHQQ